VPVLACKCGALYCTSISVQIIGTCAVQHVMWCQAEYALYAKPPLRRGIRPQSPRRLHNAAVHMLTALLYSAVQLLAVDRTPVSDMLGDCRRGTYELRAMGTTACAHSCFHVLHCADHAYGHPRTVWYSFQGRMCCNNTPLSSY
jgi:hypothetical protein